jgi:hypothetical protein
VCSGLCFRWWGENGGVVADDLPTIGRELCYEQEVAIGVATASSGAVQMELSGDGGEVVVEGLDFELGEGESSHFFARRVGGFIVGEHLRIAVLDGGADEEDVGRVFVAGGEGVEIAVVPVIGRFVEDGEDSLFAVGGIRLSECRSEGGRENGEAECGADGFHGHKVSSSRIIEHARE